MGVGDVGSEGANDSSERPEGLVDSKNTAAHVFGSGFADEATEAGLGEPVSGSKKDGATNYGEPRVDEGHRSENGGLEEITVTKEVAFTEFWFEDAD